MKSQIEQFRQEYRELIEGLKTATDKHIGEELDEFYNGTRIAGQRAEYYKELFEQAIARLKKRD